VECLRLRMPVNHRSWTGVPNRLVARDGDLPPAVDALEQNEAALMGDFADGALAAVCDHP
jgi:hypothetical protein